MRKIYNHIIEISAENMIVGINIESIDAKRHATLEGNIRIDNNVTIVGVKDTKIPIFDDKISQIDFKFSTKYTKEDKILGIIGINGGVLYKGDTKAIKESFAKDKKLPEKIGPAIINSVLSKCIIRTIDLAEHLSLPPPIGMPSVLNKRKQNLEYIG